MARKNITNLYNVWSSRPSRTIVKKSLYTNVSIVNVSIVRPYTLENTMVLTPFTPLLWWSGCAASGLSVLTSLLQLSVVPPAHPAALMWLGLVLMVSLVLLAFWIVALRQLYTPLPYKGKRREQTFRFSGLEATAPNIVTPGT